MSARAVTVADFYHRGGNGPTTVGDTVLGGIEIAAFAFLFPNRCLRFIFLTAGAMLVPSAASSDCSV